MYVNDVCGCVCASSAKVIGKFSIRLVPDMDPAKVNECVSAHVSAAFAALGSPNKMKLTMTGGSRAWVAVRALPQPVCVCMCGVRICASMCTIVYRCE